MAQMQKRNPTEYIRNEGKITIAAHECDDIQNIGIVVVVEPIRIQLADVDLFKPRVLWD